MHTYVYHSFIHSLAHSLTHTHTCARAHSHTHRVSSCHQHGHANPVGAQVLIRYYDKSRGSIPQVGLYHARVMVWTPTCTTPISGHEQRFDICFPSHYQVPIDVTAVWAGSPGPRVSPVWRCPLSKLEQCQ